MGPQYIAVAKSNPTASIYDAGETYGSIAFEVEQHEIPVGIKLLLNDSYDVNSDQEYHRLLFRYKGQTWSTNTSVAAHSTMPPASIIIELVSTAIDLVLKDAHKEVINLFLDRCGSLHPDVSAGYLKEILMPHGNPAVSQTPEFDVSTRSRKLPGVNADVAYPCDCKNMSVKQKLWNIIQHLNDHHKWSREKIADWLELIERRDGIDMSF